MTGAETLRASTECCGSAGTACIRNPAQYYKTEKNGSQWENAANTEEETTSGSTPECAEILTEISKIKLVKKYKNFVSCA